MTDKVDIPGLEDADVDLDLLETGYDGEADAEAAPSRVHVIDVIPPPPQTVEAATHVSGEAAGPGEDEQALEVFSEQSDDTPEAIGAVDNSPAPALGEIVPAPEDPVPEEAEPTVATALTASDAEGGPTNVIDEPLPPGTLQELAEKWLSSAGLRVTSTVFSNDSLKNGRLVDADTFLRVMSAAFAAKNIAGVVIAMSGGPSLSPTEGAYTYYLDMSPEDNIALACAQLGVTLSGNAEELPDLFAMASAQVGPDDAAGLGATAHAALPTGMRLPRAAVESSAAGRHSIRFEDGQRVAADASGASEEQPSDPAGEAPPLAEGYVEKRTGTLIGNPPPPAFTPPARPIAVPTPPIEEEFPPVQRSVTDRLGDLEDMGYGEEDDTTVVTPTEEPDGRLTRMGARGDTPIPAPVATEGVLGTGEMPSVGDRASDPPALEIEVVPAGPQQQALNDRSLKLLAASGRTTTPSDEEAPTTDAAAAEPKEDKAEALVASLLTTDDAQPPSSAAARPLPTSTQESGEYAFNTLAAALTAATPPATGEAAPALTRTPELQAEEPPAPSIPTVVVTQRSTRGKLFETIFRGSLGAAALATLFAIFGSDALNWISNRLGDQGNKPGSGAATESVPMPPAAPTPAEHRIDTCTFTLRPDGYEASCPEIGRRGQILTLTQIPPERQPYQFRPIKAGQGQRSVSLSANGGNSGETCGATTQITLGKETQKIPLVVDFSCVGAPQP